MGTITPRQMLANADACLNVAYAALGDAQDWLRSDWPPGTVLTDEQAARRARMRTYIAEAKEAINEAKR